MVYLYHGESFVCSILFLSCVQKNQNIRKELPVIFYCFKIACVRWRRNIWSFVLRRS